MFHLKLPRICLLLALCVLPGGPLLAQDATSKKYPFRLSISTQMDMTIEKEAQKLKTETDLKYAWERTEPFVRELTLQQTGVRVFLNGKSTLNAIMNQYGTANVEGGKTKNVRPADAPEEVRTMLADTYGPPLCRLTVNENGEVVKQEVIAKPGAKIQVDNGMIANGMLFHAPFFADRKSFDRPIEISMGNGGFATGKLQYTRAKEYDPDHPKLYVQGKATKDKHQPTASNPGMTVRNATYDILGEQVFDPMKGEWSTGKLTIKIAFQLFSEEKNVGQAQGTMTCELNSDQ